jgi:hypothetical protein
VARHNDRRTTEYYQGLKEIFRQIQETVYDPDVAAEAERLAARNTRPFKASEYREHLKKYPALAYLHLVTGGSD